MARGCILVRPVDRFARPLFVITQERSCLDLAPPPRLASRLAPESSRRSAFRPCSSPARNRSSLISSGPSGCKRAEVRAMASETALSSCLDEEEPGEMSSGSVSDRSKNIDRSLTLLAWRSPGFFHHVHNLNRQPANVLLVGGRERAAQFGNKVGLRLDNHDRIGWVGLVRINGLARLGSAAGRV